MIVRDLLTFNDYKRDTLFRVIQMKPGETWYGLFTLEELLAGYSDRPIQWMSHTRREVLL